MNLVIELFLLLWVWIGCVICVIYWSPGLSIGQELFLSIVGGPIAWLINLGRYVYSLARPICTTFWNYLGQIGPSQ